MVMVAQQYILGKMVEQEQLWFFIQKCERSVILELVANFENLGESTVVVPLKNVMSDKEIEANLQEAGLLD